MQIYCKRAQNGSVNQLKSFLMQLRLYWTFKHDEKAFFYNFSARQGFEASPHKCISKKHTWYSNKCLCSQGSWVSVKVIIDNGNCKDWLLYYFEFYATVEIIRKTYSYRQTLVRMEFLTGTGSEIVIWI